MYSRYCIPLSYLLRLAFWTTGRTVLFYSGIFIVGDAADNAYEPVVMWWTPQYCCCCTSSKESCLVLSAECRCSWYHVCLPVNTPLLVCYKDYIVQLSWGHLLEHFEIRNNVIKMACNNMENKKIIDVSYVVDMTRLNTYFYVKVTSLKYWHQKYVTN